jgi:signal transduction histidine kinase
MSPAKRSKTESAGKAGAGIQGMQERIRQFGGILEIGTPRNGSGTIVIARLPVGGLEMSEDSYPSSAGN